MRVDCLANVRRVASHFDGEAHFADQIASMGTDDTATEKTMVAFIEQELGEALVSSIGDGAARRCPRKDRLAIFQALRPALVFGQSCPGDFGISVRNRWDLPRNERTVLAGRSFGCDMRLMHRLVRQHRLPDNIADRKDVRHICAHLLVYRNETTLANGDACFFGFDRFTIWA